MRGADNIILAIYNKFKYGLFHEMERYKLEECMFYDYQEYHPDYGRFCFKTTNMLGDNPVCNISITIDKFECEYYDNLVDIFKSHAGWLFEISEYDYNTDTFDIIFKRSIYYGEEKESYGISSFGINIRMFDFYSKIADYMDVDERSIYEAYEHTFSMENIRRQLGLPVCKELPTLKFDSPYGGRVPNLSKPPIFNPPATICYWTDGTRTVVKCQEGDTYSPEAGLALCYMKKVLGNTSRDLNKELHKYIPEEKED